MPTQEEAQAIMEKLVVNGERLDGVVNGPATGPDSEVAIDVGSVKTLSRVMAELEVAVDEEVGQIEETGDLKIAEINLAAAAQIALIASTLGAAVFADTTAGLANSSGTGTTNRFFLIPGDNTNTFTRLYRNDAGSATFIASDPSALLLQSLGSNLVSVGGRLAKYEEDLVSQSLFGIPVPVTGGNWATQDSTRMFATPMPQGGRVIEIGGYGNNSGGAGLGQLKWATKVGSNFVSQREDLFDVGVGSFAQNVDNGQLKTMHRFEAGWYPGLRAFSTTSKIATVTNGAGAVPFYHTAGNATGTFAVGTYTTNTSTQFYIKVQFDDGSFATVLDTGLYSEGRTITVGRTETPASTGFGLSSSGAATTTWMRETAQYAGKLRTLRVATENTGPLTVMCALRLGGTAINVYYSFTVQCTVAGLNTFSVLDGTLPRGIPSYGFNTLLGFRCGTNDAHVSYSNGSANIGQPTGFGVLTVFGGDLLGPNTFTRNTQNRRYEYQLEIDVATHGNRVNKLWDGIFFDEDWAAGTLGLNWGMTGTVTNAAGYCQVDSAGINMGVTRELLVHLDKTLMSQDIEFGSGTCTRMFAGLRAGVDDYGTLVTLGAHDDPSVPNTLVIHEAWKQVGSTFPNAYVTITNPFGAGIDVDSGHRYRVIMLRDVRDMHIWVWDLSLQPARLAQVSAAHEYYAQTAAAGTTLTVPLNTWVTANDLGKVGQMTGAVAFGCITGTGMRNYHATHQSLIRKGKTLFGGDSMNVSRVNSSVNLIGKLRAILALEGDEMFNMSVDGSDYNSQRRVFASMLPHLQWAGIENTVWGNGMQDYDGGAIPADQIASINGGISQIANLSRLSGIKRQVWMDTEPDLDTTTGTDDPTDFIRSMVLANSAFNFYGVPLRDWMSKPGTIGDRQPGLYQASVGDAHRVQAGHDVALLCLLTYAPFLCAAPPRLNIRTLNPFW